MATKIYQVQIVLIGSKPKIWRRILIDSNTTLLDFHRIIQTAMGWTNSHLHMFTDGQNEYSPSEFELDGAIDSSTVKLNEILKKAGFKIVYEYDFGDGWEHDILLEEIRLNTDDYIPTCIDGKNNCPPEDCGGIWGYRNMLEILERPNTEEYEDYIEWLGGEFDPKYFNKNEINEELKKKDFGCIWL